MRLTILYEAKIAPREFTELLDWKERLLWAFNHHTTPFNNDQLLTGLDDDIDTFDDEFDDSSESVNFASYLYQLTHEQQREAIIYIVNRLNSPLLANYFATLYGYRIPELEPLILTNPAAIYHYMIDVIRGPWPEARAILDHNPRYNTRHYYQYYQNQDKNFDNI